MEGGVNEGGGRPASATSNEVTTIARVVKRARDGNVRNRTFARETASARERERDVTGKDIILVLTLKEYRWFMDILSYSGFS